MLHRKAPSSATPSGWRAPSDSTAPSTLSLAILPLCGVFGFNQTMATLAAGRPNVLVKSYEIDEIARLIAQHRPSTLFGSDDMFARLLELVPGEKPFPSVKWMGYAGFNVALENIAEARRGARPDPARPLRHERSAGALCQPAGRSRVSRRKLGGGVP